MNSAFTHRCSLASLSTHRSRWNHGLCVSTAAILLVGILFIGIASHGTPRVLPAGELPNDTRLAPPKDLDGYFPFTPSPNPDAWKQRSESLRRQILVSLGLWPLPTKAPLHPVIHGAVDREDYTVEKVFFESMPGFYVTGNLYRPKHRTGKLPGVLCPHGHWTNGRFYDNASIQDEIKKGAEKYEEGGRSVLQARCVQLARMGCVVFHYDMLGYADSVQIPMSVAHGFAKQRPEMNTLENWGLFSPQAESHSQNIMGLQTFNSIRALDFLLQLPEVDSNRIGVTGASGGGTQTFILCAIDPRPTVAFPAVMVSTAMQGGCTCENACGLRVGTGNVEFAALYAPKPLGMTGADDWTKEMATKGFPELNQHFSMLGHPENVEFTPLNQFGHNYNYPSRAVMYRWMNQHLHLNLSDPIVEGDYKRLSTQELSVWDEKHPAPAGGPEFERKLLRWWTDDATHQLWRSTDTLDHFRALWGPGIQTVIGRSLADIGPIHYDQKIKQDQGSYWTMAGVLKEESRGESCPVLFFHPKNWNGRTILWIHPKGKSGLCETTSEQDFKPNTEVRALIEAGCTVAGIDLLYQGEFLAQGDSLTESPKVKNPRESAAFTLGYNASVCASRCQDILKLIAFVQHHETPSKSIELVGLQGAAHWVAAARAVSGTAVTTAVLDTAGFRFGSVASIRDPDLLPGAAKFGDIQGMIALGAPGKLHLAGETRPELIDKIYKKAASFRQLSLASAGSLTASEAVAWLLQQKP